MSTEENRAATRRFWEEVNKKNLAVMDELIATNYVGHLSGVEDVHGPEELKQLFTTTFTAFPDFHVTIEDMIAEGDKVVVRVTETGTHKGEYQGMAPTGKRFTVSAISINRVEGGKSLETWQEADHLSLMQQLGVIPSQ